MQGTIGLYQLNVVVPNVSAGDQTIEFIVEKFPRLTREEAYMIASVAVDYHVTQVVDGTKGVHGMIPKSIFKQ